MVERGVSVSGLGERVGEIDEQSCSRAYERFGHAWQDVGELLDRFRLAELAEGVPSPSVEVGSAEEQERQFSVDRLEPQLLWCTHRRRQSLKRRKPIGRWT